MDYFKVQILPKWKDVPLNEVKSVAVEKWLRSLKLANGTKAKIRNLMSALFSHCIRLDFDKFWFNLRRGLVHIDETKLKREASRKRVPMMPELAQMLQVWRTQTPYPVQIDWVFASPFTRGERPYWPDSILKNHVRRAAIAAGITKTIGWHTYRHSVGSHLGQSGENVKVVQELLRHASSRITQDVYQQADQGAKRSALGRFSGVLSFPAAKTA